MAVTSERPGVYASYEVSSVLGAGTAAHAVGIAAAADSGAADTVYTITDYAGAVSSFGAGCDMTKLIGILFKNGASLVKAVPVSEETASGYETAFGRLALEADVRFVVCGSADAGVHAKLKTSITGASDACGFRIGVAESAGGAAALVSAAAALDCERMALVGPSADCEVPGCAAAAVAGLLSAQKDPALPVNGAELYGLNGLTQTFSETEIDTLIRGGVTPIENVGGIISVIRGVTTRTTTAGAADATWRELTTIMIVDEVIPAVRDSLRARFARAKNTAQTRGAIRTQVILELQDRVAREIISSYGAVTVSQDTQDPTLCLVDFEFAVAHGLNRIELKAHITV